MLHGPLSRSSKRVWVFAVDACRFVASYGCEEGCDRGRKTVLPLQRSKAAKANESREGRESQPSFGGGGGEAVYMKSTTDSSVGKTETGGRGYVGVGVGARLTVPERFVRRSR